MATSPRPSTPGTYPAGAGPMRRLVSSLAGHNRGRTDLGQRLRGALPLRYPSDAGDPAVDPLTGLGSQQAFLGSLEFRARLFEQEGIPYSLVLIDIDHLGLVNLQSGSVEGDRVLRRMAEIMRAARAVDARAFRIGGDEFAVLMPGAWPDAAVGHAAQLLEALQHPSGDANPGTFSSAVACVPATADGPELVYRQALSALLDVKLNGRCGVAVFRPERHSLSTSDRRSAELVERAISKRELQPVFQPIIDLHTGHVLGYEGLARLSVGGVGQGTRELFMAADAAGRIAELDLACVEAIVGGARAISPDRLLTINLSPRTLAGREFEPAWLLQSLVHAGISPGRVVVELSDVQPVGDLGRLQRSFSELQRFGLRLAADDVSVNDPTRRLLTHVPFDIVKIDLSQFWEGAQSGPRLAVLRDTALGRRARVVAEGVETSEQFVAVRDLEIGAGQGYLLGRPGSAVDGRDVDLHRLEAEAELLERQPAPAGPIGDEQFGTISPERLEMFMPISREQPEPVAGAA